MSGAHTIIIIGGGMAGTHAAQTLRNEGYEGGILLFDRDPEFPYDRPPLSKEYMLGEATEKEIGLLNDTTFKDLDVELKLGIEINQIDPDNQEIVTSDGEKYPWDKLLITTGSKLRRLRVDGDDLENIFYLKTLSDARSIKEKLPEINKIVIVGAGFIGAELASTYKKLGIDVTIIEMADLPMARILGEEMGRYFLELHRLNDVEIITNDSVKSFYGNKKVEGLVTNTGKKLECQAVVIGIGVEPNILFSADKLTVERGYIVNEYGETSIPKIYAAGDCAMWPYKGNHIHVEHWDHAIYHAKSVAKNMLVEQPVPYNRVPYFWSDQYGNRFQYLGYAKEWAFTVIRGSLKEKKFIYFYLDKDYVIKAAMIVNDPKSVLAVRKLIDNQNVVRKDYLMDTKIPLKKVHMTDETNAFSNSLGTSR